jgi:16S rRNA G527 N7-methylase RsmG
MKAVIHPYDLLSIEILDSSVKEVMSLGSGLGCPSILLSATHIGSRIFLSRKWGEGGGGGWT